MNAMTIDGFQYRTLTGDGGVELSVAVAGSGPALVLLHGFPQTHFMWRYVAHELADRHTVIVPDLRGYGSSAKPADTDSATYSKRTMANDVVRVAAALGFARFGVVGHDRGALERVSQI
ncbi:alpha/beta fold hydrolase [Rhodococcus sovatensis]|uniref:alpha/beta fold hydrolase n=1 Tax=Rhodococcus sovatensis TaxID=1805840 RepID=UPI003BB1D390